MSDIFSQYIFHILCINSNYLQLVGIIPVLGDKMMKENGDFKPCKF